jgi:hypothetical protein
MHKTKSQPTSVASNLGNFKLRVKNIFPWFIFSILHKENRKKFQINANLKHAQTRGCQAFERTKPKNNATLVKSANYLINANSGCIHIEVTHLNAKPEYLDFFQPGLSCNFRQVNQVTHDAKVNHTIFNSQCCILLSRFWPGQKKGDGDGNQSRD